jgi:hypothetical protein
MKLEQAKSASVGGLETPRTLAVCALTAGRHARRLAPAGGSVYTPNTMRSRHHSLLLIALGLSRPWAHS